MSADATAQAEPPYIRVREARKVYSSAGGEIEALSKTSFEARRGEFVAVLGPSGCGKTTLLMMCGGLESITAGSIEIAGEPMSGPRSSIGVMFQDASLLPWKTVLDNVLFPIHILKRRRADYMERAMGLLDLVGLQGFEHKRPHELSGGMRQRVAICRALVFDPDMLLMDEPFSALDAITRDEMNEALLDIWQRYTKTALFVTHSIREAVLLADRVLVMSQRPATIIEDVTVPFARPRTIAISDTVEFNQICARLRTLIEQSHGDRPRRRREQVAAASAVTT